jgi:mono/diheme cytochrome c family protein
MHRARTVTTHRTSPFTGLVALALVASCGEQHQQPLAERNGPAFTVDPTRHVEASPAVLDRGARVFSQQCSPCHGARGAGDGPAAYLLYPKPRNFQEGPFRFTSTWEGIPTDDDLFRTISRGIPGSAMPSWGYLPEADRWAVLHFVKSLSKEPLVVPPAKAGPKGMPGQGVVEVPPEPPIDDAGLARGKQLFAQICLPCHGPHGEGDGPNATKIKDDDGIPIRPRNLTTGVFKGDPRPQNLYRRILHGIRGTPMPQSPMLAGDDGWNVVHFVRSLSSDRLRDRAEMKRYRIPVVRVDRLPDHPDSGAWHKAPRTELHLMPLWWRYTRPEYLSVQAVHDGKSVAVLLMWQDATEDKLAIRHQDFRDAAAIELAPPGREPPFFAMGERGRFVNIWMWKAEREALLAAGFQDLEAQYPNIGIDSYPNLTKGAYEQPARHAMTLASDPTFITAWGAGNIVADPTRKSATEDLSAQGFGTLRARPRRDQAVDAHGEYSNGSYRVMFSRALAPQGEGGVALAPGSIVPAAFAIWDGSAGDRDGTKSVTIWQELYLQP